MHFYLFIYFLISSFSIIYSRSFNFGWYFFNRWPIVCGNALNMDQELYLIDGKPVKMGVINKITVYKDGKFASISQAYNSGWITKEDVAAIEARIEQYSAAMEK